MRNLLTWLFAKFTPLYWLIENAAGKAHEAKPAEAGLTETELRKRVYEKLVEFHTSLVWEINKMSYEELEQMNRDLLRALHEGHAGIGLKEKDEK